MTEIVPKERVGGWQGQGYCSAKNPLIPHVWCRRFPDHEGDHAAFAFLISEPEMWPR